ncbi:LysM peptidoglycan-binding domain-containing protein [Micromonospora zingiberis]|uniref:LysM peptidoglycan-binding domain-containing protein n=2 Tax=Micromonospora zingiberis TaxID=2053011 RepID=A0A4R0GGG5_9ACTN|nr:LysM peptidoglycan-binding domain-containing protein [Micromonospora zingiberis]
MLTGFGALVVLVGLLVGGPIALLAFAGNPLPDHVPTLAEIGTTLTSRDDGQLFLRALALVGWFGWATFALSVLVELGAQTLRRPAPRLPGMGRQQRAAAALVGSVALILAASPAASAATTAYTAGPYAAAPTATVALAAPGGPTLLGPATSLPATGPATELATGATAAGFTAAGSTATGFTAAGFTAAGSTAAGSPAAAVGPAMARADRAAAPADAPVYRVAKGDYLGKVADRYLDDFDDYRKIAELNGLRDPDRIRPGQLIKLPAEARDQGARAHATGRLVSPDATPTRPAPRPGTPDSGEGARPAPPKPGATTPDGSTQGGATQRPGVPTQQPGSATPTPAAPEQDKPVAPRDEVSGGHPPVVTVGAARAGEPDRVNRPLAISAVLAVASIVGAQIGAVLGLRRRPAAASAAGRQHVRTSPPHELPVGRHRKD